MNRHIIIDLLCDTDDDEPKHLLLDDIEQEISCCWHSQISYTMREVEDELQTDCYLCKWFGDKAVCGRCRNRNLFAKTEYEPQTERSE